MHRVNVHPIGEQLDLLGREALGEHPFPHRRGDRRHQVRPAKNPSLKGLEEGQEPLSAKKPDRLSRVDLKILDMEPQGRPRLTSA